MSSHRRRRSRRLELVREFLRRLRARKRPLVAAAVIVGSVVLGYRIEAAALDGELEHLRDGAFG